jgi:hypothetical protein
MKNKIKLCGIISLASLFIFSFSGCNEDEKSELDSALFAIWHYDEACAKAAFELTKDGILKSIGAYDNNGSYEYFDFFDTYNFHIDVSYTTKSGVITTTAVSDQWNKPMEGTADYKIEGNKLILTNIENSSEFLVFSHFKEDYFEGVFYKK